MLLIDTCLAKGAPLATRLMGTGRRIMKPSRAEPRVHRLGHSSTGGSHSGPSPLPLCYPRTHPTGTHIHNWEHSKLITYLCITNSLRSMSSPPKIKVIRFNIFNFHYILSFLIHEFTLKKNERRSSDFF